MRTELIDLKTGYTATFPQRFRDLAPKRGFEIPDYIEALLGVCEHLTDEIKEAERKLAKLAKEDDVCRRLMTVPGVGPVTAVRFRAVLDDVSRFDGAHGVASYLGLTPGERSSSLKRRRTGITKAGPADMRKLLSQAAWSYWRTQRDQPMAQWADRIADRRGRAIASVALARKLSGILFALWRDGTHYDPQRAAAPVDADSPPRSLPARRVRALLERRVG